MCGSNNCESQFSDSADCCYEPNATTTLPTTTRTTTTTTQMTTTTATTTTPTITATTITSCSNCSSVTCSDMMDVYNQPYQCIPEEVAQNWHKECLQPSENLCSYNGKHFSLVLSFQILDRYKINNVTQESKV